MGHFPSWPLIEIRRPYSSSSQMFSTVPAFPSVRTTALPTSSDRASSNARRIVDARSFAVGMVVSEIRPCARVFALKSAKVATVRRREQGLLPSELSRQAKENPVRLVCSRTGYLGGRTVLYLACPQAYW